MTFARSPRRRRCAARSATSRYRFEGSEPDDITNATNRSPYPTLHLLREASVERAVEAFGDTDEIYRKNIRTLQALGRKGWAEIQAKIGSD